MSHVTVAYLEKCKFFKFVVCNPCQSSPSLTNRVPLWFIIISLVFFYLCKVLFSGFLQFNGNFARPLRPLTLLQLHFSAQTTAQSISYVNVIPPPPHPLLNRAAYFYGVGINLTCVEQFSLRGWCGGPYLSFTFLLEVK